MSSLVNWFHRRRSPPEVNAKNKMSVNGTVWQTTLVNKERHGQGGREKILKKQMSLPSQPNYAYFYVQSDEDDLLLNDHDLVYGNPNIDFMVGYKPFWKVQRRYSEYSHLSGPFFHGAQWHQHAPFGRRVPSSPGLVLDIAYPQKRRPEAKVSRSKSDSLFNYVPKAFSEQDASRILFGEKRDDALKLLPAASSMRPTSRTEHKPRQRDAQNERPILNSVVNPEQKKNNANVKRLAHQLSSLDKPSDLDSQKSLDLNQNLPDGQFYFSPSLLLDNRSETVDGRSAPHPVDGGLHHVTDKDYNINCKSADEEVSNILSEFKNIDQYNGNNNNNGRFHGENATEREFLY